MWLGNRPVLMLIKIKILQGSTGVSKVSKYKRNNKQGCFSKLKCLISVSIAVSENNI